MISLFVYSSQGIRERIERPLKDLRDGGDSQLNLFYLFLEIIMAGYVAVNRLSLIQLHTEERKQRAHVKKIAEMKRRSGLDNSPPAYFPRGHNYTSQLNEKQREIVKENDVKSKKILEIMQSKNTLPNVTQPLNPIHRPQKLNLSSNNSDYMQRIAKTKGIYDAREWKRGFEEHQLHLKISKNNKLFTPRDIGANRQRVKAASVSTSRRTTPSSSVVAAEIQPTENNTN